MKIYKCNLCGSSNLELVIHATYEPYADAYRFERLSDSEKHFCRDCMNFGEVTEEEIEE